MWRFRVFGRNFSYGKALFRGYSSHSHFGGGGVIRLSALQGHFRDPAVQEWWFGADEAGRGRMKARRYSFPCALIALAFGAGPLWAQSAAQSIGITVPSIATSLPQYGDPFGTRKWLNDRGITYSLIYTNDVLGNLSGGIRTGTIDQGKLETQLLVDLEKLAGWKNWSFYANAFGIYNDGRIRRDYVGGINTIAAIEATPTVRLSELWLERWAGPVSFRFGQLAADAEFFYSIGRRSRRSICRAVGRRIRCRLSVCE